jgi:uncharacterized membrane protein YfcA
LSLNDYLLVTVAAVLAGGVNALAGGGSLLSFPALLAIGVPPVSANITNTVALCPGYLGGTWAQRDTLQGQHARLRRLTVVAGLGGLTGAVLLVITSDKIFEKLIPVLLFAACGLLAGQDRIRARLRIGVTTPAVTPPDQTALQTPDPAWLAVPIFVVAIYGGYFGAGLGIMLLAVLGIVIHNESLTRLNGLKQALSLVINVVAALFFVFSGKVQWGLAGAMAVGSLVGGNLGGRMAGRLSPKALRAVVITVGLIVAVVYLVRYWW